eukprot:5709988-Pleurochrysis_carterae.AAC.1
MSRDLRRAVKRGLGAWSALHSAPAVTAAAFVAADDLRLRCAVRLEAPSASAKSFVLVDRCCPSKRGMARLLP